jgi:hypothetical protein
MNIMNNEREQLANAILLEAKRSAVLEVFFILSLEVFVSC